MKTGLRLLPLIGGGVIAATISVVSAQADEICYEERIQPEFLQCADDGYGPSADFVSNCTVVPAATYTVEVPCPTTKWINAHYSQTHEEACAAHGLQTASLEGKICASGENRPQTGKGFNQINYVHGTWGVHRSGGIKVGKRLSDGPCRGRDDMPCMKPEPDPDSNFCWRGGQKGDFDSTDLVVAYACQPKG